MKNDDGGYLEFFPGTLRTLEANILLGMPAMTVPWLSQLYHTIFSPEDKQLIPTFFVGPQYKLPVQDELHWNVEVDNLVEQCFSWFKQVNQNHVLQSELARCYEKLSGFPPARWQRKHIMACTLIGDVEKLQRYLEAFERGERLGFIPIIKQEYFERAIRLAKKHHSGELVSPVKF